MKALPEGSQGAACKAASLAAEGAETTQLSIGSQAPGDGPGVTLVERSSPLWTSGSPFVK